ncbi:MAG: CheR family methyltransferase, partial [bacterium]
MKDDACVRFLQWALPRLGMRWPGYRKVRGGVCKRVARRIRELRLRDINAYRLRLEASEEEWKTLDGLLRVSISRFYRGRALFDRLKDRLLPGIAEKTIAAGGDRIHIWCAGCASGEEPYTLALIWRLALRGRFPDLDFRVTATDADAHLLSRAGAASYSPSSLKELPGGWRDQAFDPEGKTFRLKDPYREGVEFHLQDIRRETPSGPFDLILCRNLAFTYFGEELQREVLKRILGPLRPGGFLVIGAHEELPGDGEGMEELGEGVWGRIIPAGTKG